MFSSAKFLATAAGVGGAFLGYAGSNAGAKFQAGPSRMDTENVNIVSDSVTTFGPNVMQLKAEGPADEERSFIMIKPDGVHRGLIGDIIKRFETKGFKLVALRMMQPGQEHLEAHYADLAHRPFFPSLVKYMASGPVVAMCWEGQGVVKTGRVMLGETNPKDSKPGTIRGDYCIQVGRNICHGSDAVESADHEIKLWFKEEDLCTYKFNNHEWIYGAN